MLLIQWQKQWPRFVCVVTTRKLGLCSWVRLGNNKPPGCFELYMLIGAYHKSLSTSSPPPSALVVVVVVACGQFNAGLGCSLFA